MFLPLNKVITRERVFWHNEVIILARSHISGIRTHRK